jgi:hypothetical protein
MRRELYRRQTHLSLFDVRGVHALHRSSYERFQPAHALNRARWDDELFSKFHDTFLTSILKDSAVMSSCSAKHCTSQ